MVLEAARTPLVLRDIPRPAPGPGQVLVRVEACALCRTDLHIIDGDLPHPKLPLVLGHEIVGRVEELGSGVSTLPLGTRVGVPWLGGTCSECSYCASERENLCSAACFTGYDIDGGFAEYALADERYCFPMPSAYGAAEGAPLLCAGLIGYRSLVMAGDAKTIGLYGFGAAAHILAQVCLHQGREVFAFTRPGDEEGQRFARRLGAAWAGASDAPPPKPLDAALIFAPVGALVPLALDALAPGGTLVLGGIHMSEIPPLPYEKLWMERRIVSVANLTRADATAFLSLAPQVPVRTHVTPFALEDANEAVAALRAGRIEGAAVLVPATS